MPSRRMARELALQALFSVEIGHRDAAEVLDEYLSTFSESAQRLFVKDLVLGTLEHSRESDERITPLLEGWTIERLPTIDRLLLRMAAFELRHRPQTPRPVIINEAVELAKRFSTEDSGRFVNGVLSALVRANGHA
ncbi:MAG TPA: transcription antitermination factor NusB [Candidatus Baltobacteraceae bacterium]|nr:transcription antitermination factor NusB [Candidatus Baltobacteraceae bacterium]